MRQHAHRWFDRLPDLPSGRVSRLLLLGLALALAGCAAKEPPPTRVFWPALPAEPKLEWLGTFASDGDFPRTKGTKALESVIGSKYYTFFKKPLGIAADGEGKVYVVDRDVANIRVYDFNDFSVGLFSKEPVFRGPIGIHIDSRKRIYVADADGGSVLVYDAERKPLFGFGSGRLEKPVYVAVNERLERIYVTDVKRHRLVAFDMEGAFLFEFGQRGGAPGLFNGPQGIAIDAQDRVFVADQLNARIQVFDPDGAFLYEFGKRGDQPWEYEAPRGLAFSKEGHLFVVDPRKAALQIVRPEDGRLLLYYTAGKGQDPLAMAYPTSVWIDDQDRVYVSDMLNLRFMVFQFINDAYLRDHPLDDPEAGGKKTLFDPAISR